MSRRPGPDAGARERRRDVVVAAGTGDLVGLDPAGRALVLAERNALAVAVGGVRGAEFLTVVVIPPEGPARLVVAARPDDPLVEEIQLPDAALLADPAAVGMAATSVQLVAAMGDGGSVTLVRVPVTRR